MITRVWLQILGLMVIMALPLIMIQHRVSRESADVVFELTTKVVTPEVFDSHLQLLRKLGTLDPAGKDQYKAEFQRTLEARQSRNDLVSLKDNLIRDLQRQNLWAAFVVLALCLGFSFLVSRGLVGQFRKLAEEHSKGVQKLETLRSLESWQATAKVLVHELKGFLMPVKLLATDFETKYRQLPPDVFGSYLQEASGIIRGQTDALESMVVAFTRFGKLPAMHKAHVTIAGVIDEFVRLQQPSFSDRVAFEVNVDQNDLTINADSKLLGQLFYNLVNNAAEANKGQPIKASFVVKSRGRFVAVRIANTGVLIPPDLVARIFDVHVSSKTGSGKSNMGLGLAIAKKIALDHGGDLVLVSNDPLNGVVFELELPLVGWDGEPIDVC